MLPRTQPFSFANTGDTSAGLFQDISTRSLQSVRIGQGAGTISSGIANAFIGVQAGMQSTQGSYTVAIGYQSAAYCQNTSYSTLIGAYAGTQISSGNELVFIGYKAGELSANVNQNVGIGAYALRENTTGNSIVAVGYRAGEKTLDGGYNTMIGALAGQDNRSGNFNTMAGYQTGRSAFLGNENTYFGAYAGYSNAFGSANTLIGTRSGELLYNGNYNIFIGYKSGQNFKFGDYNIAIGPFSMQNASSGTSNIIIGSGAGISGSSNIGSVIIGTGAASNASITQSVVIGTDALSKDKNGTSLVVIGYQAAQNTLSGSSNTFIGAQVAQNLQSGDYNVTVGAYAMQYNIFASSNVVIGNGAAIYSKSNTNSVIIGTNTASNANLTESIIIGTNTANNATTSASIVIGYKSAQHLINGNSNILIGNGADVFRSNTTNAISISSSNTYTADNSISIGTNLSNERYNSVLLGKNLITDADQTVIIGNDINIQSILYFKDPLNYNLKGSVLVDAVKKLNVNTINYQDSLIRPDGTILNTANMGMFTTNIENSFTNPTNTLNSNIVTDVLFKIPTISNVAIIPDIVVPMISDSNIININQSIINSFTPKNNIPIVNISNVYNTKLLVNYNFEIPKTIFNNDGKSKNIITTLPIQGIWSTHIENSNCYINFNDSIVSIYNNLFICGNISSSEYPTLIYNSDGTVAYSYIADNTSLINGFIIKYNSSGNVVWYTITSSFGNNSYKSISIDKNENIYCTGYIGSNSSNIYNSQVLLYNSNISSCNIITVTSYSQQSIVTKYNTYGILQWANIVSANSSIPSSKSQDSGQSINIFDGINISNIYCSFNLKNNNTLNNLIIRNINNYNYYLQQTIFTTSLVSYNTNTLTTLFKFNTSNGNVVNNQLILNKNVINQPSVASGSLLSLNSNIYTINTTPYANALYPVNITYPDTNNSTSTISISNNGPGVIISAYTYNLLYIWSTIIQHTIFDETIIAYISKDTYDKNIVIVGNYKSTITFYNSDNTLFNILQNQTNNTYVYIAKYNLNGQCIWISYINSPYTTITDIHISLYDSIYITGTYTNTLTVYNSDNSLAAITLNNTGCYLIEYNNTGFAHFGTNISKNGVNSINLSIFSTYLYVCGSYSSQFSLYDPDGLLNDLYYLETTSNYPNLFVVKYEIVNNSLQYILPNITTNYIYNNHLLPYTVDFHLQYENILQNNSTSNSILLPMLTSNEPWTISFWYKQITYSSNTSILFVSPNINILYISSNGLLYGNSNNNGLSSNITLPNSNITYQLSLNTWYNFTLTGGFMSNINNLYINGIYTYQFNNNTIINTYLFNSSNDYITATGNSQNIIGWTRLLTYNEIYTLYNNTEKYIPSINESIYSNIAFIFDLTNINTNTNTINNTNNNSNYNAIILGNSNSYLITNNNNLPVVNLRNFNISNTVFNFEFPKRITPLKTIGNCNTSLSLNNRLTIQQSTTLSSNLFKYIIDSSGTSINNSNGIYLEPINIQYVITTLPKYGTLSKYVFNPSDTIIYTQDLEYTFVRNDIITLSAISYIIDNQSNIYGLPATSNYTINFNINTSKLLSTDTIVLKQNQERILNVNDVVVIQDVNKSYIPDNYIFKVDPLINSNLIIGYSNNISLIYNTLINTVTSNISGYSNVTSNIILYTQSHIKYYDNSNNYLYTTDLPLIQFNPPILSNIIYTYTNVGAINTSNYYITNSNIDNKYYYTISSLSNIPIIRYSDIKNNKISIKSSSSSLLNTQTIKFNVYTNNYDTSNNLVPLAAYIDVNNQPVPVSATFQILNSSSYNNYQNLKLSQLQQTYLISMNQTESYIYFTSNISFTQLYIYTYPRFGSISLSNIITTNSNLNSIYYYPTKLNFTNDIVEFIAFNNIEYIKLSCTITANNNFRIQPLHINTLSSNYNIYYESNVLSNILSQPINGLSNITSNIIKYSIQKDNYYDIRFNEYIYSLSNNFSSNIYDIITITSNANIINNTASNIYNYYIKYYGSNIYRTYSKLTLYQLYNANSNIQYTNITNPNIYNNGYNIIKKNTGYINQWLQDDINNNLIYIYWSNINLQYTCNLQYTFSALSTFINLNVTIYNQSNIFSNTPIIYKNSILSNSSSLSSFNSLSNIFMNDYNDMIYSNIISNSNNIKTIYISSIQTGIITNQPIQPYTYITSLDYVNIQTNGYYNANNIVTNDIIEYFYLFNNNTTSPIYKTNLFIQQKPLSYGQSFTNGLTKKINTLSQYTFYHSFNGYSPQEITIIPINIPNGITIYNLNTNSIISSINTFTISDIINNYITITFNTNIVNNSTILNFQYNIKLGNTILYNYNFPLLTYYYNDFINNVFINNNSTITIEKFINTNTILNGLLWDSLYNIYIQGNLISYDDIVIIISDNSKLNGFLYNLQTPNIMLNYISLSSFINNIIRYIPFNPSINSIVNELLDIYIYYKGQLSPLYTIKLNNYISKIYNYRGVNITTLSDSSRNILAPSLSLGLISDGYKWTNPNIILNQKNIYSNVFNYLNQSNIIWSLSNTLSNNIYNSYSNYYIPYSLNNSLKIIQPIYYTSNIIISTSNASNITITSNIYYQPTLINITSSYIYSYTYSNVSNYNIITEYTSNTYTSNIIRLPLISLSSNVTIVNTQYGSGKYIINASTEQVSKNSYNLFDYNSNTYWESSSNLYNIINTIYYSGSIYTLVQGKQIFGEYIDFILPQNYILLQYSITLLPITLGTGIRNPSSWFLLGSTTYLNNSWNIIDIKGWNSILQNSLQPVQQQFNTNILGPYYLNNNYPYKYYRLIITSIGNNPGTVSTTDNVPNISELNYYYNPNIWSIYPSIELELYSFITFTFTNMGATGRYGPSTGSEYEYGPWGTNNDLFYVINGFQYWVVPRTGTYKIIIAGAGTGPRNPQNNVIYYAYGAVLTCNFNLQQGHIIKMLVGQSGPTPYSQGYVLPGGSGGSGGTYIYNLTTSTLLFVAGGAGGIGYDYNTHLRTDASLTTSGKNADGNGGTNGSGGFTAADRNDFMDGLGSAAGGGFNIINGNGSINGFSTDNTNGGQSFLNGGLGGSYPSGSTNGQVGGFGGGGAAGGDNGSGAGGGGGGYSGGGSAQHGGAGNSGGGGGSYDITGLYNGTVTNSGMGYINISLTSPNTIDITNSNISYSFTASSSNYNSNAFSAFDYNISTSWTSSTSTSLTNINLQYNTIRHHFTRLIDSYTASVLFSVSDTSAMNVYNKLLQYKQFIITNYVTLSGGVDSTNSGSYNNILFTCINTTTPDYLDQNQTYIWMNYTTSTAPVAYFKEHHYLSYNIITYPGYNLDGSYNGTINTTFSNIQTNTINNIYGEWIQVNQTQINSIIGYELTPKIILNKTTSISYTQSGSTSSSAWITSLNIGSFTLPTNFAEFALFTLTVNYTKPLTSYGLDWIYATINNGITNSQPNDIPGNSILNTGGNGSLSFSLPPDGIDYYANKTYQIILNWWSPGAQFSSITWSLTSTYYSLTSFNYISLPKNIYLLGSNIDSQLWNYIDTIEILNTINYPNIHLLQSKSSYSNYRFVVTSNNIYNNNLNVSIGKIQLLTTTLYNESNYINLLQSNLILTTTSNLTIVQTPIATSNLTYTSNIQLTQYISYNSNITVTTIPTSNINYLTYNKAVYNIHCGTNVSLSVILKKYINYDIDNIQNLYFYIIQNPAYGIIQNVATNKTIAKCTLIDILNDNIVYQHLGYYGDNYIDPTLFYTDTIYICISTTPYDLSYEKLHIEFNIIPMPTITKNLDTYIFANTVNEAISSNYIIDNTTIFNSSTTNTNILITSINTFQTLTNQYINTINIDSILPTNTLSQFNLSPLLFTQSPYPFNLGFNFIILNNELTNLNNSNNIALTLVKNSLANLSIYKNSLTTTHQIYFNKYIDTNIVYPSLYDGTTLNTWSNLINLEVIKYEFNPYFGANTINNNLYSVSFTFDINPSMYLQQYSVNFLLSYRFSFNFIDNNNNNIQRFQFTQTSLSSCILSTRDVTYPNIKPLNINNWNNILIIVNDPNYNYNISLYINNLYINLNPILPSFSLQNIKYIQFIVQITNPDESYNFVPSLSIIKNLNTFDTLQAQYILQNSHTDIYLRNFIININTNSITTSNIANSNITNVILGKSISVKGLNNICIGNEFSTSGQNSIILGNQIGISSTTNEIYESIVIGNQSFTNTLVRNITSIGNNNLNNLYYADQNKVLNFLNNKPIIIGNDIDVSKIDYHINIGNTFLKTNYNNTNQIYLGNNKETIGIGYLSNVELSTDYQLQVNGNVTLNGNINYSGSILENGIPIDTVLSGANLIPSTTNASIITKWLKRTISLFSPFNINSYWSSPIDFTPLPIKLSVNTSINNGAYMGSINIPDNRVLFIPLASTSLGIFNPNLNIFSSIPGFPGNNAYNGGVLAADGSVVFIPANTSNIGLFMPSTNNYSIITPIIPQLGVISLLANQYRGGVLLPNKKILFSPFNATNIGIFDISYINNYNFNYGFYTITPIDPILSGNGAYNGCVLIPDGRVIFVPANATSIGIYNYTNTTIQTNYGFSIINIKNPGKYSGGVLLSDGRVLFIPSTNNIIGIFNPTLSIINNSYPGYSTIILNTLSGQFAGGVLLPDGNVLFIPFGKTSTTSIITIFNPITNSISTISSKVNMVGYDYYGGSLIKDGRVICSPYLNNNIGILSGYNTSTHQELCLHPMFNKL